jgi:sarcosine oxidase subunit gamma
VQGDSAPDMLSKLCAVDLRPHKFDDLNIAQTSVARLNAIVLRADAGGRLTYHLLADSASAAYMLACLRDSAEEFGGSMTDARIMVP